MNDEAKIQKIPLYYARACDTAGPNEGDKSKALEWLRKGFTEDCTFSYFLDDGSLWGSAQGVIGFAEFAYNFLSSYRHSHHAMSNILVEELKGNTAKIHTYGVAKHLKPDKSTDVAIMIYVDDVIRQNGEWKVRDRKGYILWFDNFAPEYSLLP